MREWSIKYLSLFIVVALLLGLSQQLLSEEVQLNWLFLLTNNAVLKDASILPKAYTQLEHASKQYCRLNWPLGIIAGKLGDLPRQQTAWSTFLNCHSLAALHLVHAAAPHDTRLAEQSVQLFPTQSESWFWLGETMAQEGNVDEAIEAYDRAVQLDPKDGVSWCSLGKLWNPGNPGIAKEAYKQCCFNGDPGLHGCWNAAQIEEQLGDIDSAIFYYRMSRWSQARQRADELEKNR